MPAEISRAVGVEAVEPAAQLRVLCLLELKAVTIQATSLKNIATSAVSIHCYAAEGSLPLPAVCIHVCADMCAHAHTHASRKALFRRIAMPYVSMAYTIMAV